MNENPVAPHQFALFRVLMGMYLTQHFLRLIPYGTELFSSQGMLPSPEILPTYKIFPNILSVLDTPAFVTVYLIAMTAFSVALTLGIQRRYVAFILWYGWASLLNRNIFISNPGLPYMGWILLALAVVPVGEPLTLMRDKIGKKAFSFPPVLFTGAWILMGVGYTLSGLHKAQSPSWQDGTALWHVLQSPIAREYFLPKMLLEMPLWLMKAQTWFVLLLEASFIFWCYTKKTRPWIWLAIMGMHAGILLTVDFPDLTFGVLMIHLFTFDQRWLRPHQLGDEKQILFFDGVCGLCNNVVDLLLSASKGQKIKFSPLQGARAEKTLGSEFTKNIDTIVYFRDGKTFTKSAAVARVLFDVGGFWALFSVLMVLPAWLSNFAYDLVAANRYKLFGKKDSCRMPTPEERSRFC